MQALDCGDMTVNPYPVKVYGPYEHTAWNEGYNQAIRDAVKLIQEQHGYTDSTLEALKKVVE